MESPVDLSRRYTVEEYLAIDEGAEVRYEYRDGEIIDMSGGTFEHALIASNLIRHAGNRLAGSPCRVFTSDLRVRALRNRRYCHPDVTVVCGQPVFDPPNRRVTVVNPKVVFEVLSTSTELSDRGEKFDRYRQADSLSDYFLVAQDRPRVEPFFRQPDGMWLIGHAINGLDGVVHVRSLNIDLPLAEIYEAVELPPFPAEFNQPD